MNCVAPLTRPTPCKRSWSGDRCDMCCRFAIPCPPALPCCASHTVGASQADVTQLSTRVRESGERESAAMSDLASARGELTTLRINMERLSAEKDQAARQAAWLEEEVRTH